MDHVVHVDNSVFFRKMMKIFLTSLGIEAESFAKGEDVLEFIMAGATAVAVGTANFTNPRAVVDIVNGIENFMESENINDINEIRGAVSAPLQKHK